MRMLSVISRHMSAGSAPERSSVPATTSTTSSWANCRPEMFTDTVGVRSP